MAQRRKVSPNTERGMCLLVILPRGVLRRILNLLSREVTQVDSPGEHVIWHNLLHCNTHTSKVARKAVDMHLKSSNNWRTEHWQPSLRESGFIPGIRGPHFPWPCRGGSRKSHKEPPHLSSWFHKRRTGTSDLPVLTMKKKVIISSAPHNGSISLPTSTTVKISTAT